MLVNRSNFDKALKALTHYAKTQKVLSYDTETTCLPWWQSTWHEAIGVRPRVFALQIATDKEEFYFDFQQSGSCLNSTHFEKINDELTSNPDILWFIANAKFDLHHSLNHGIEFAGTIHCTKAIARVANNLEPSLSLDSLAEKYLGAGKLDVLSILKERGHVTKLKKFGLNDKYEDVYHFDRLELKQLIDYGCKDVRLCFDLGVEQIKEINRIDKELFKDTPGIKLSNVLANEYKLTKLLFKMEREGIKIDRTYTEVAYMHEVSEYQRIEKELNKISEKNIGTSMDWLSPKKLKALFDAMDEPYSYTEKGNACFDKDALEESNAEVAKLIVKYRYHNKRAHTYFENFIWFADSNDILHADMQQAGTDTGRMSCWNPNLYNIPKRGDKEESNYKVRKCFVPKPGKILCDIDYKGAEYYMSVDYAREMPVVEDLKNGVDPHKKLGLAMGLERDPAKTMQFRILYGGGGKIIGRALGYRGDEAARIGKEKKAEYFKHMPNVADLIRRVSNLAGSRGYIFNWFGRVLQYDRQSSYKATNGLIQSGVGDMTKVAMVNIDDYMTRTKTKSKMLLQVYDAILFEMDPSELYLVKVFKHDMESVYPYKVLPMRTDAAISKISWSDLEEFTS